MLRATRRVMTPGAAADLPEGVEMLDVSMAEYVVESSPGGPGSHPFGALLVDRTGNLVLEAENTVVTGPRIAPAMPRRTSCAWRAAVQSQFLHGCTLYTSTEPCAMCARRHLLGQCPAGRLRPRGRSCATSSAGIPSPTQAMPCREVFARGQREVEVGRPHFSTRRGRCTRASGAEPRAAAVSPRGRGWP